MSIIASNSSNYKIANSYLSISEADELLLDKSWADLNYQTKVNALVENSLILDSLWIYLGEKSDRDQILEFPRRPETKIEERIKRALAYIVKTKIAHPDFLVKDIKSIQIGEVKRVFNTPPSSGSGQGGADMHLFLLMNPYIGFQKNLSW